MQEVALAEPTQELSVSGWKLKLGRMEKTATPRMTQRTWSSGRLSGLCFVGISRVEDARPRRACTALDYREKDVHPEWSDFFLRGLDMSRRPPAALPGRYIRGGRRVKDGYPFRWDGFRPVTTVRLGERRPCGLVDGMEKRAEGRLRIVGHERQDPPWWLAQQTIQPNLDPQAFAEEEATNKLWNLPRTRFK